MFRQIRLPSREIATKIKEGNSNIERILRMLVTQFLWDKVANKKWQIVRAW